MHLREIKIAHKDIYERMFIGALLNSKQSKTSAEKRHRLLQLALGARV
jgi:hypothetical protein